MGLQSHRSPNFENFETKWHLDVAFVANYREYYKGEDGGFPQVRAMVSFVSMCMLVVRLCTKSVRTMH
jgi:alpha-ketoglutarate-dependent taurine dioxygenase